MAPTVAPAAAPASGRYRYSAGICAALLACGLAFSGAACAAGDSADLERERLAVIEAEIIRLQELVAEAAAVAPAAQRVKFHYEWLINDLELMRQGISEHLDAPRQPRPVTPMRGDYRQ